MEKFNFPVHLNDKIYEIRFESDNSISNIVSYFPFTESEKQEILSLMKRESFNGFNSIFSNSITEEKWNTAKEQIKKKFQDELFAIDKL